MQVAGYIALILLFPLTSAMAQQKAQREQKDSFPEVTLPKTQVRFLHSSICNDEYKVFISLPKDYNYTDSSYPVLYLTDANTTFATAAALTAAMGTDKELPGMIIIGIGYRTDSLAKILRLRDLTPVHDPSIPGSPGGKSALFLRFIREELMPFIKKNYRADDDAAYSGSSIGGLFGLYVLFHEPETFQRYLIASPSIWYDSSVISKYEQDYAKNHPDLPARVYLSVGGEEETATKFAHMETNLHKFSESLKNRHYPHLQLRTQVLEGETHFSVYPAALSHGLRFLFKHNQE